MSKLKGRNFLNLLNNNFPDIEPWITNFGFSNSLCVQAIQAITNHAPIGEN